MIVLASCNLKENEMPEEYRVPDLDDDDWAIFVADVLRDCRIRRLSPHEARLAWGQALRNRGIAKSLNGGSQGSDGQEGQPGTSGFSGQAGSPGQDGFAGFPGCPGD